MLDHQISRRNLFRNSALLSAGILLGYGAGGVRSLNAEEAKKAPNGLIISNEAGICIA